MKSSWCDRAALASLATIAIIATGAPVAAQATYPSRSVKIIAAQTAARAAPDGYTLMIGYVATHATIPAVKRLR